MTPPEPLEKSAFGFAAKVTLAWTCALALLALGTAALAKTPWPQLVFLNLFRQPGMGLLTVVLTPQPLFSPIPMVLVATLGPLCMQGLSLWSCWQRVGRWTIRSRFVYVCFSLVPVFGPIAAYTLMQSWGDLD